MVSFGPEVIPDALRGKTQAREAEKKKQTQPRVIIVMEKTALEPEVARVANHVVEETGEGPAGRRRNRATIRSLLRASGRSKAYQLTSAASIESAVR